MTDPEQVVFTSSATHGLNIAIRTLVKPGGRVVISGYEHNAVTRPLHAIPGVEITVADAPLFDREEMVRQFALALETPADAGDLHPRVQRVRLPAAGGGASRRCAGRGVCSSCWTPPSRRGRCRWTWQRWARRSSPCRDTRDCTARRGRGCCCAAWSRSRCLRGGTGVAVAFAGHA